MRLADVARAMVIIGLLMMGSPLVCAILLVMIAKGRVISLRRIK